MCLLIGIYIRQNNVLDALALRDAFLRHTRTCCTGGDSVCFKS